MKIQTLYDNGVGPINEDNVLVSEPLFGVFDGASDMEHYVDGDGQTGAAIASSIAKEVFSSGSKPLAALALDANDALREAMEKAGIDVRRKAALWATSAAVVKVNHDTFEWLRIGDCFILTIRKDGTFSLFTDDENHDLESLRMLREFALQKNENIREALTQQMFKVRDRVNIDYGDLNGEKEMEKFLKQGTVPLEGIAHILLFTDGLLLPKENPELPDNFEMFVDLYNEGGLQRIQDVVREMERADAKCWKYPRFKQHDDIAAVAISF